MEPDPDTSRIAVVAHATPIRLVLALRALDAVIDIVEGARAGIAELSDRGVDLVVVEHDGARIDGLALIGDLRATLPETPILLLLPGTGAPSRREAMEAGATDVIIKPFDLLDLQVRARNLSDLAAIRRRAEQRIRSVSRFVSRAVTEAAATEREIIRRLMLAAEFRDDQASDHLTRVAGCAIAIAEGLGLSQREANDIALASVMHDIGKISIPDTILLKAGPLSDVEREEMKQHALRGFEMLNDSPSRLLQLASEIALSHHERWDGGGYPRGLAGTDIPLPGRIIAVADVFDALISERVYKPAWSVDTARQHLEENSGTHFDPDCIAAFVSRWDDIVLLTRERPTTAVPSYA